MKEVKLQDNQVELVRHALYELHQNLLDDQSEGNDLVGDVIKELEELLPIFHTED